MTSIRSRLLRFLIGSLLLMVSGAALVTYWVALESANNAYDRSLLEPAFDIADNIQIDAAGVHLELEEKALEALVYDQVDRVIFQVRSPEGTIIGGVSDLPPPPDFSSQNIFVNTDYRGQKFRIAVLRASNGYLVQVGETLNKRNRLLREILVAELVPTLLIAMAAIALAWFGVARALIPLGHLRSELLSRGPRDLRQLKDSAAPVEIVPVINAFNGLLDQLHDANTRQQRFLANAAHQLRTPLAGLQTHLELLLRRELSTEVRNELQQMHGATVRASRLANQLLALAKAESAAEEWHNLEIVDLMTVADAAARSWAPKALAQQIDLGFVLKRAVIPGDPLLLPELLDNLIDNALRYTPRGGVVTVSTGCVGDVPYLSVDDSGPGIPPAERRRVRERFYRIAGTSGDGSGLGLAIVQEVVDRHDGDLDISTSIELGGACVQATFRRIHANAGRISGLAGESGSHP